VTQRDPARVRAVTVFIWLVMVAKSSNGAQKKEVEA
jgi:hypothetical protein